MTSLKTFFLKLDFVCLQVYCEMGLNGGKYTFLNPQDLPSLTNAEVQAMFRDRTSFLMRVRRSDTKQPYGVLQQLSQYRYAYLLLRIIISS